MYEISLLLFYGDYIKSKCNDGQEFNISNEDMLNVDWSIENHALVGKINDIIYILYLNGEGNK